MLIIINIVYSYDCPDDQIVHLQTDSSQICYSLHAARYLKASATTYICGVVEAFSVSELTNSKLKWSEIRDGKAEKLQGIQQV
jgi:hypothetical protein